MSAATELPASSEELLEHVVGQRWSGANDREPVGLTVLDHGLLRAEKPVLVDALVELRYGPGTHDVFQLILSGGRAVDALEAPLFARTLIALMRAGATVPTLEGAIEF